MLERTLTCTAERRRPATGVGQAARALDQLELQICKLCLETTSRLLRSIDATVAPGALRAIEPSLDESVVAQYLQTKLSLSFPLAAVFRELRRLSEQTYENKALTFGCVIDSKDTTTVGPDDRAFPHGLAASKKHRALSDGFRTAFKVSRHGALCGLADLPSTSASGVTGPKFYPDWAEYIAENSRNGRVGISLTRHGDILIYERGSLRFTYRFGQWQYWNHSHIQHLMLQHARVQNVKQDGIKRNLNALYRTALDVSFRRTGGLFVLLRKREHIKCIVQSGEGMKDPNRMPIDRQLDRALESTHIGGLAGVVLTELAGLDGAVVFGNTGELLAYGAVLSPRKKGALKGSEGSRTKAAIGASNYGLAIKISSDGDISVYSKGDRILRE